MGCLPTEVLVRRKSTRGAPHPSENFLEVLAACWVGKTGMRQGLISDIGRSTSKVKAGGCIWTHGTISGREQGSLKTCGNSPALHVQVVAAALLGGTLWWKRLRQSRV